MPFCISAFLHTQWLLIASTMFISNTTIQSTSVYVYYLPFCHSKFIMTMIQNLLCCVFQHLPWVCFFLILPWGNSYRHFIVLCFTLWFFSSFFFFLHFVETLRFSSSQIHFIICVVCYFGCVYLKERQQKREKKKKGCSWAQRIYNRFRLTDAQLCYSTCTWYEYCFNLYRPHQLEFRQKMIQRCSARWFFAICLLRVYIFSLVAQVVVFIEVKWPKRYTALP